MSHLFWWESLKMIQNIWPKCCLMCNLSTLTFSLCLWERKMLNICLNPLYIFKKVSLFTAAKRLYNMLLLWKCVWSRARSKGPSCSASQPPHLCQDFQTTFVEIHTPPRKSPDFPFLFFGVCVFWTMQQDYHVCDLANLFFVFLTGLVM